MQLEEIKDEEMYVMVAPDGSPQLSTLAPDYATCIGFATLLSKKGIGQHPANLFKKGFEVLRVKISMQQMDDAEAAFQAAKKKYS
jgi:hypothetical protein